MKQNDISAQVSRQLTLIERRLQKIAAEFEDLESDFELLESEKAALENMVGAKACKECGQPHPPWRQYKYVPAAYFDSCVSAIKCVEDSSDAYSSACDDTARFYLANLDSLIRRLKLQQ